MKIHLAFLCPYNNTWIGGWDRKYGIYYRNLDDVLFEKYMIYVTSDASLTNKIGKEVILTEDMLTDFCREKKIEFLYFGGGKISKDTEDTLLRDMIWLVNINFTPLYTTDPRKYNLIISMTDYWKLHWMHGSLSNSFVVYNPIDVALWTELKKTAEWKYRAIFTWKKYIVGRMARAEPSKWHYLILATLKKLDTEKNYSYGFLFAWLPWLYRKYITLCLSKEMQSCIHVIPEQRNHEDIATFYASIDIFWQVSWIGESFGNVIAEAACFEVPTLTDIKGFYKNGHVDVNLYDAQIELVDDGRTGAYRSTPRGIITWLEALSTEERHILWKHANEKVVSVYAIEHTIQTLAKTLYEIGRSRGIYETNIEFEKIEKNPSDETLFAYEHEYGKRVALWEQFDTISGFEKWSYTLMERIFRAIEYIYLLKRKLLKRFFSFDIEKF